MEKQTKILIGLAAAGVVAYLVYNKSKNSKATIVTAVLPPMSAKMPVVKDDVPMSNIDWKKLMDGIDMSKPSQMCPDCGTIGGNPIPISQVHPADEYVFGIPSNIDTTGLDYKAIPKDSDAVLALMNDGTYVQGIYSAPYDNYVCNDSKFANANAPEPCNSDYTIVPMKAQIMTISGIRNDIKSIVGVYSGYMGNNSKNSQLINLVNEIDNIYFNHAI